MAKKLKIILAVLLAAVTFGGYQLLASSDAGAAEQATIHIQVSPVKQKISIAPGSSYVGSYKVQNVGTAPFTYTAYATPYSVTNENYDANYSATSNYTQIADWITFDEKTAKGTVAPGSEVSVQYTVNVPEDAPAGGQYAALMAQTDSGNDDNATIQTVHRVGMLLYAAVPGETRETGEIIKNTVNSFYFNPPVSTSTLVKNTGNIHQTAKITTNIWPLFSKETAFSNADNPTEIDVMPETSRFNSTTWENAPTLGIFWAEQTVEFAGQVNVNKKFILICPLWLLFIIFALIFFIIFWLVSRVRDRKRASRGEAKKSHGDNKSANSSSSSHSKEGKEE
ncbi:hypothetical protein IJG78_03880 [Candidatus Saccharibacteria bacterium]|nr:hypothetical protein [Candidatus Saccharibacteria bacterium]